MRGACEKKWTVGNERRDLALTCADTRCFRHLHSFQSDAMFYALFSCNRVTNFLSFHAQEANGNGVSESVF